MSTYPSIYLSIYSYLPLSVYPYLHVYLSICMHIYLSICMYIYLYLHIYFYLYIHIYLLSTFIYLSMKIADVIPVYKPNDKNENVFKKNYRPVNFTPIVSKVFGRNMFNEISLYVDKFLIFLPLWV